MPAAPLFPHDFNLPEAGVVNELHAVRSIRQTRQIFFLHQLVQIFWEPVVVHLESLYGLVDGRDVSDFDGGFVSFVQRTQVICGGGGGTGRGVSIRHRFIARLAAAPRQSDQNGTRKKDDAKTLHGNEKSRAGTARRENLVSRDERLEVGGRQARGIGARVGRGRVGRLFTAGESAAGNQGQKGDKSIYPFHIDTKFN